MRIRSRNPFATVRTSGLLLPIDLLARIADGDPHLPGLSPKDYHLRLSERLNEAASRAWNECLAAWRAFRRKLSALPSSASGTSETRDDWLLPLFRELGYGQLQTKKAIQIGEREYPISHGWENHVPIHLLSARYPLDRRTPGVAGAAAASPYSMMQELLNRSAGHRWGFLSNGLKLYILHDNAALARAANVEFDLEAMMDGEVYSDFLLLFLICHQSRVEIPPDGKPDDCWLEKWASLADEQGTRAREKLRNGVEASIQAFGAGFLATRGNSAVRDRLRSGALSKEDYYRQLLRLVYRLLLLLVAEEKTTESGENLLHPPGTPPDVRDRYARFYSIGRLRALAEQRRGTHHPDLYESLKVLFLKLREGYEPLGIPGLGSFLFSDRSTPDLDSASLANESLLDAIRHLCFTEDVSGRGGAVRRPVDFAHLGSEELGSVYESLLELHPQIDTDEGPFKLTTAAGHERKTTGSYYTPRSLINCLLDSALDPVVQEALDKPTSQEAEQALLNLKVCDPASGSGHFLIAAAERMATHLARLRTGDREPTTLDVQHSKRDIIGRCIYGVDINPMAVELCKVSLWMEALEPGRPLSFLDHHIQCGNSLLGATPALLANGIPDDAFTPIEGDDKSVCSELKKDNKRERRDFERGYRDFHFTYQLGDLPSEFARLTASADESVAEASAKEHRYAELVKGTSYRNARLLADAWCAAFAWKKDRSDLGKLCPTERTFRNLQASPDSVLPHVLTEIEQLRETYRFFHWYLAYPDVFQVPAGDSEPTNPTHGWNGGFDVMLGNPPWDTLSPDAKEFFSTFDPQVRFEDKAGQRRRIDTLLEDLLIAEAWSSTRRHTYASVAFIKDSGQYRLFAPGNLGKGDFNVFRMFVEVCLEHIRPGGMASQIVPDGLYSGANSMAIRKALFERFSLSRLWSFENARECWFTGIDSRTKFCLYAAREGGSTQAFDAAFCIRSEHELNEIRGGGGISIPVALVREFSPDALAISEVQSRFEIDIARKMYERWPKFAHYETEPPHRRYMREVDMGSDRGLFIDGVPGVPVYEGRMVSIYDHRAKAYRSGRGRSAVWEELSFRGKEIVPQWRIPEDLIPEKAVTRIQQFRLGFCDVASPTNERTMVAALIPSGVICGHSLPTLTFSSQNEWLYCIWLASANSFALDFVARQKVSLHMTFTVVDSLPFPMLSRDADVAYQLVERVLRLSCTGPEMVPFWNEMARGGWCNSWDATVGVPGVLNDDERLQLRAELDVIVARDLYSLTAAEMEYILSTFPTAERYEVERYSEFRTRRMILEQYDKLPRFSAERKVRRETATAGVHLDPAFPRQGVEKLLCACMLDFVQMQPCLSEDEYVDLMILAMQADRCAKLLIGNDRSQFVQARKAVPAQLIAQPDGTPPWRMMLNCMLANRSLIRSGGTLAVGDGFQAFRQQLPAVPGEFIRLVGVAADRLREIQESTLPADAAAVQTGREIRQQHASVIGG